MYMSWVWEERRGGKAWVEHGDDVLESSDRHDATFVDVQL